MKKNYKIAVFFLVIIITAVGLTSGISKKDSQSGGYRDLVEELYNQAVKQNDNLSAIEDGIQKFYKKRNEAIEKYNSYIAYNNRYYADAKTNAVTITDSMTKQRTNDIISKSEKRFKSKNADWQNTIDLLNANEKELNNLYTLLQIMITEPMIDKYQTNGLPDNAKSKEANTDLLKVIEKIRAITK